jgi:hypothetical protein
VEVLACIFLEGSDASPGSQKCYRQGKPLLAAVPYLFLRNHSCSNLLSAPCVNAKVHRSNVDPAVGNKIGGTVCS